MLTGTSVRKGFGHGLLVGLDVLTGDLSLRLPISDESVICSYWHPVINQIVVGSADDKIRILYDPKLSQRGITTSLTKLERKKAIDSVTIVQKPIYNPSVYEDEREKEMEKDPQNPNNQNAPSAFIPPEVLDPKLAKEKKLNDPKYTHMPEMPL